MTSRVEAWQNSIWSDMVDDDDDADSDTDSRLSGSVIVDSVMRRLQKGFPGERSTLDPIIDHNVETEDTDGGIPPQVSNGYHGYNNRPYTNGSHQQGGGRYSPSSQGRRPQHHNYPPSSPKTHHRYGGGGNGRREPSRSGELLHPFTAGRRKEQVLLSPVPETITGGTDRSLADATRLGGGGGGGVVSGGGMLSGPSHRSMENVVLSGGIHRPPPDGYTSPNNNMMTSTISSNSPDSMSRSHSEHIRIHTPGGSNISRRGTVGPHSSPYHPYIPPTIGPGRSPQLPSRFRHPYPSNNEGSPRHNYHEAAIEHRVSSMGHSTNNNNGQPNLNDVIDYLASPDPNMVANAASYLQHSAYGDDNMKAKIRQFGGIPALLRQVRNSSVKVHLAVLGALRNLSFGRANNENKIQIAQDAGLPDIVSLLRNNVNSEVRELVTSVIWNLSSCDEIKLRIIQCALRDIVESVLVPNTGCSYGHPAAKDYSQRTNVLHWTTEMRNALGALRNISSAGIDARRFLRGASGLVDTLVWIVRAATGQDNVDEKTIENAICILRNLSFQIEHEIDTQEGADDDFDTDWERQIQQEIEAAKESIEPQSRKGRSFILFCARPQADNLRKTVPRLTQPRNLATPDSSLLPRRSQPVRGAALLWQPEIIFPYLALMEKFSSNPDLMEAAAASLQNLTACSWKWAVYQRHLIRKANGLTVLIECLNHTHDTVVGSVATALRNLATDETNKTVIGQYGIQNIIPRLPFGQNSLGISEATSISLLCTLMELCLNNTDNTRVLREKEGITSIVRLTQSREHTPKLVYAAHKLCSVVSDHKVAKSILKQQGWDSKEFQRLTADGGHNYTFDLSRPLGSDNTSQQQQRHERDRKKRSNSDSNVLLHTKKESSSSLPLQTQLPPSQPTPPPPLPPLQIQQDIPSSVGPTYHIIPSPKTLVPSEPIAPIGLYAEINTNENEPDRKISVQSAGGGGSQSHSRTGSQPQSEPRSSPVDQRTGTPHEGLSGDEEPPGNAMYAQIDYDKKREERKRKEVEKKQQQKPPPLAAINTESIDSWV